MEKLLLFFAVSLVSTGTPGPAVLYVSSQGVTGGMRSAASSSLGILSADALYILLSITGLTTVLLASYELFTVIRWVGAIYLVYLGLRLIWAGLHVREAAGTATPAAAVSPLRSFVGGFVVHASNPKALLYFGSLVPQFVDPLRPLGRQLASLTVVHLLTASAVLLVYCLLSARLRRSTVSTRVRRTFSFASGTFLVGAGVSLALARKAGR